MSLLLLLLACGRPADEGPQAAEPAPLDVEIVQAAAAEMPTLLHLTGSIAAVKQVQVPADTNGVVVETRFARGDRVKKGQVLAVVDSQAVRLGAAASTAQAEAQRVQLEQLERDCARTEQLFTDGAVSAAQAERTRASCDAQRRAAEAAQASAGVARENLARTQIRAPFDGVVGERLVDVGAFVGPSSPVATLYADGGLVVRIPVPEAQLPQVELGQTVRVWPHALPGVSVEGTLRSMSGALREQTHDVLVEAELATADPDLRPGMFARVEVEGAPAPATVVPAGAVVRVDTADHLFAVREGRAYELVVRTGVERDGRVVIPTDLAPGDAVVLHPPAELRDGRRVQ